MHNIVSKKQHIQQKGIQFDGILKAGYELAYNYANNPFQISTLDDNNYRTEGTDAKDLTKKEHKYEYDANGNLVYINTERPKKDGTQTPKSTERKLLWDEENRLEAIDDNGFVSNYWYDAAGERTVKTSGESQQMYVNSVFSGGDTQTANFTAYVNPYLVVSKGGQYTKHIYIGSQRIVSKLGDLDSYGSDPRRIEYAGSNVDGAKVDYATKYTALQQTIKDHYAKFEVPYYGKDNDDYVNGQGFCCDDSKTLKSFAANANDNPELFQYYYHSDHLGSSSLITNLDGEVVQHIEYVPFGEVFIEERNNTWNTPYLFNAKELDEETGLYYYGARYYDPRVSIWLSTDPLQEKYPNISTYAYTFQNPVKYIDPTGMEGDPVSKLTGSSNLLIFIKESGGEFDKNKMNKKSGEWDYIAVDRIEQVQSVLEKKYGDKTNFIKNLVIKSHGLVSTGPDLDSATGVGILHDPSGNKSMEYLSSILSDDANIVFTACSVIQGYNDPNHKGYKSARETAENFSKFFLKGTNRNLYMNYTLSTSTIYLDSNENGEIDGKEKYWFNFDEPLHQQNWAGFMRFYYDGNTWSKGNDFYNITVTKEGIIRRSRLRPLTGGDLYSDII